MTAIERTRLAMRGEPVDRLPTFPIMLATACQLPGVRQRAFNQNGRTLARTLLAARELCGCDGIYVSRDNWVCHEALGGRLTFPEDDESYATECLLGSVGTSVASPCLIRERPRACPPCSRPPVR